MKKLILLFAASMFLNVLYAQIDKEKLALAVSKADAANTEKLKDYIWKRYSSAMVSGAEKATLVTEFSFNENGELQVNAVGGNSSVEKKPGVRGRIQQNQIEESVDYIGKALELSLKYTYMSKGELMDFLDKAVVTEKDGIIEAVGGDVFVKGDKLTLLIDPKTNLFISKKFSSLLGTDPMDGDVTYAKLSNGVQYGGKTVMNLPAKKAVITAVNKDFTQRVK
jgi:hypothetical protein